MDGGGRVVGPLDSGFAGGRGARAVPRTGGLQALPGFPIRLLQVRLPRLGRGRRSSVSVPLARRIPRLAGTFLTLGFFALTGITGLVADGQYAVFRDTYGDPRDIAARTLGFRLEKITIAGINRLAESRILAVAGISPKGSLPFLGVQQVRERLEADPFIKSAEVRKLYPRELLLTIVEREPFALWQKNGDLFVVARDGTVIDGLKDASLASLPLVVGEMANERAADYVALLAAAGPLRSQIRAGMLVSGRRWNLKMQNGLDVRLPEEGAAAAMARLVRLDREAGLLGKDVLAVDLRMSDRIVVRLTEEAAAARTEGVKKKLQRGVKGVET